MKYERLNVPFDQTPLFQFVGVYPVEKDYIDWSDHRANPNKIAASQLIGGGGCPHCGAAFGLASCDCGQIFCVQGDGEVECPACHQMCFMTSGDGDFDFDITRARG